MGNEYIEFEKILELLMKEEKNIQMFCKNNYYDENILSSYLDNTLSSLEKEKFEKHLLSCSFCREQLILLSRTLTALEKDKLETTPEWLKQKALALGFEKAKIKTSFLEKLRQIFLPSSVGLKFAVATISLIIIIFSAYLVQNLNHTNQQITKENKEIKKEEKINPKIIKKNQIKTAKEKNIKDKQKLKIAKIKKQKTTSPKLKNYKNKETKQIAKNINQTKITPEKLKNKSAVNTSAKTSTKPQVLATVPLDKKLLELLSQKKPLVSFGETNNFDFKTITKTLKEKGTKMPVYGIKSVEFPTKLRKELNKKPSNNEVKKFYLKIYNEGTLKVEKKEKDENKNEN